MQNISSPIQEFFEEVVNVVDVYIGKKLKVNFQMGNYFCMEK